MAESVLIVIALALMGLSLFLVLIPVVPVSALEWAIAILFGILTGFSRLTPVAVVAITGLMVLGATAGIWMPFFGLRGKQLSCMGLVAFFCGTLAGQILIPIPFVGMMIGGVIAVIAVEYLQNSEWHNAVKSGGSALKLMIYGMIAETLLSVGIIATVIISIITTA